MAYRSRRWRYGQAGPAEVNWRHGLASRFRFVVDFSSGVPVELVHGVVAVADTNKPGPGTTRQGRGILAGDGGTSETTWRIPWRTPYGLVHSSGLSLFLLAQFTTVTSSNDKNWILGVQSTASFRNCPFQLKNEQFAASDIEFSRATGSSDDRMSWRTTTQTAQNTPVVVSLSATQAVENAPTIYFDGVSQSLAAVESRGGTGAVTPGENFYLGGVGGRASTDHHELLLVGMDGQLTASEHAALARNIWQVLAPRRTYFVLEVASGAQALTPTGIAGAEAFGSASVTAGAVDISPTGLAGAEAFGSHLLGLDIAGTGIAGAEAFGAHTLSPGAVDIAPTGLAGAEAFGTAVLDAGQGLSATGIGSAEAFGAGALTLYLTPTGIAGAEAFGTHVVSGGAITISATGIGSSEAFGSALLTLDIAATGIAGAEAFGSASVAQLVVAVGIAGAEAFGAATVSPGAADISPTGIAGGEAFGTHLLTLDIAATGLAGAEAFGTHTVAIGAINLTPTGIAGAELFGSPVVSLASGTQNLSPTGVGTAEAFGAGALALAITPTGIATGEALGATTVSYLQSLSPGGIASSEAMGATVVALAGTIAITFVTAHETSTTVTFTDTHGLIGTPTT